MKIFELQKLVLSLRQLPQETEWVEFKANNTKPDEIGEYLSALSNAACLHGKESAYLIWRVENGTHKIIGTNFQPKRKKVGNEDLEPWLARALSPRINFTIHEIDIEEKHVVLFCIQPCQHTPVRWKETAYIRVGSYKKKLNDYPEKERLLWLKFSSQCFEKEVALSNVSADEVLSAIDYPAYFDLTGQNLPAVKKGILERLGREKIIRDLGENRFDITNVGAILFAKRLSDFPTLARKAVRVIIYKGNNRIETIKEYSADRGYAVGFETLIAYINDQLPRNEQLGQALRRDERMYPEIAVRELVANAIIHQDFSFTGDSPLIEIFSDRIEITNSGLPLIETLRFLDEPPQSRNEDLAAFMRRLNICEERGSGIDKVVFTIEFFQLPAPDFVTTEKHTKAILFAYKTLSQMDYKDKVRACYQHACLQWVSNQQMTNSSLRHRFSIEDKNYAMASTIIADTIKSGFVKPYDPESTSKKHARYVPFWA